MPEYRFYSVDSRGSLRSPPQVMSLPNDGAAKAAANKMPSETDIEIWDGNRVVAYLIRAHD